MRNSLLTSNFLITLIKAMKKIKQRFKMSGTDIESIIPSCNGAAVLSAIPWHVSTWKKEVSCCTWKHDSISVPSQNEPGNLQFLAFEGYWYGRMGPKIRNLTYRHITQPSVSDKMRAWKPKGNIMIIAMLKPSSKSFEVLQSIYVHFTRNSPSFIFVDKSKVYLYSM